MALEMALEIGPMIAILSENKLPRYLFLYRPHAPVLNSYDDRANGEVCL